MSKPLGTYSLIIHVNVRREGYGNQISVTEEVDLGPLGFRDVSKVLERFHGIGDRLRVEALGNEETP